MEIIGYFRFTEDGKSYLYFIGTREGVLKDTAGGTKFAWGKLSDMREVGFEEVVNAAGDRTDAVKALSDGQRAMQEQKNSCRSHYLFCTEIQDG